jgi:hypothetical protein
MITGRERLEPHLDTSEGRDTNTVDEKVIGLRCAVGEGCECLLYFALTTTEAINTRTQCYPYALSPPPLPELIMYH